LIEEQAAMLILYHHNISVCAQKVRIALEEKGLPFEARHVDLMKGEHVAPEFLKINPRGLVPVLVHDGDAICESTVILEYLEDAFPLHPLRPVTPKGRAQMRLWEKWPDDGLHVACGTLSFACIFGQQVRSNHDRAALEERLAKLPDKARAARQRQLLEHGFAAPFVRDAILLHDKVLAEMERDLAGRAWLAGSDYTLADVAMTPYVVRLDRLGLAAMWERRPQVGRWYERIKARPSFDAAIARYKGDAYDDRASSQGVDVWPQVSSILKAA
jgi:glutathione S-transferase